MARKPSPIQDISNKHESWKIAVRIINIRVVQNGPKASLIQMCLMDQKGDKIEAQVKKDDIDKWRPKLLEGGTYVMQNFEVQKNSDMARKPSPIQDISNKHESWKIAVRIINIRVVQNGLKASLIQMCLMDQKGDKIEAQVKKDDIDKWRPKLLEGGTYVMQNFEVQKNSGDYKLSKHAFRLVFNKATVVAEKDLPLIAQYVYDFTEFEDVMSKAVGSDVLVDVIGQFEKIVHYQPFAASNKPLTVILKNQRDTMINCTLWESFATQLISFLDKHEAGPVVLILTRAKIKEENDKFPLSIQNSKYFSRLYINDDNIPEIKEYMRSLGAIQISQSYSQMLAEVSLSSELSAKDKVFKNAHVMSLIEIKQVSKPCYCVTVAKIEKIFTANGWFYHACGSCSKKVKESEVKESEVPFTCVECNAQNSTSVPRFKLDINVSQNNECAKFILWDNVCTQLLDQSAADLRKQMMDEGEIDPMCFPEAVDNILGKVLAFKMKISGKFQQFSVVDISQDEDTIQSLMEKFPKDDENQAEVRFEIGKATCAPEKDDSVCDTQSVPVTADFDPANVTLTPAKRSSPNMDIDYFSLEDIPSGQFSTTKLTKKTIKTE